MYLLSSFKNFVIACLIKLQNSFTFLLLAYPDNSGEEAIKWVLFHRCLLLLFVLPVIVKL